MIDTHLHLDGLDEAAISELAAEAVDAGITRVIDLGTDVASSQRAVARAAARPQWISAAVGLWPDQGARWSASLEAVIGDLASCAGVVAIGEVGLDYTDAVLGISPRKLQIELLQAMFRIGAERSLAVCLHNRGADSDLLSTLADFSGLRPVLHCFTQDWRFAEQALALGCMLSFAGPLTYPKNDHLRDVVRNCPRDRVILETDSPFLPPQAHRGQTNRPAWLPEVATVLAQLWDTDQLEVNAITTANAQRTFHVDPHH